MIRSLTGLLDEWLPIIAGSEILDDPYVRNRTTPQERERLLDRPELIRAIGDDVIASVRGSGPA